MQIQRRPKRLTRPIPSPRLHRSLGGGCAGAVLRAGLLVLIWTCGALPLRAAEPVPVELQGVGITEHLGEKIPLDLEFINSEGQRVKLAQHFGQGHKPVVLMLVYYTCQMICNMTLNAFTKGMQGLDWTAGNQFEVVTISIDPSETSQLAQIKKQNYIAELGKPEAAQGWHWYVGEEPNIKRLAAATGFGYRYDARQKQYAHSPAIFILTADGRLSRYMYGLSYPTRDLRMALLEASNGKIGSALDQLLLFCYHYDPVSRTYGVYARRIMQLGGLLSLIILGSAIGVMLWREKRARRLTGGGAGQAPAPASGETPLPL